ncbi:MAG: SDR family oxidoreductase [Phycisphaerales bacterium]|nr:SDR family oxidoreductase [Phycisphaerales bacterium]
MNLDLSGRSAIVCGGSQGIGLAAATELARLGCRITLVARDERRLRAAAEALPPPLSGRHDWVAADLGSRANAAEAGRVAVERHGACHVLVNNTGGPPAGAAFDSRPEDYLAAFEAHVLSAHELVRALVPGMKAARFGRVINITSTSVKAPIPALGISNTVRAAVANWAKSLAADLGPWGITVNNVLPGFTATDRLASLAQTWAAGAGQTPEQWRAAQAQTIPIRRFGEPAEVGAAVAFLASPAAAYITGINLPVDGGRTPTL